MGPIASTRARRSSTAPVEPNETRKRRQTPVIHIRHRVVIRGVERDEADRDVHQIDGTRSGHLKGDSGHTQAGVTSPPHHPRSVAITLLRNDAPVYVCASLQRPCGVECR